VLELVRSSGRVPAPVCGATTRAFEFAPGFAPGLIRLSLALLAASRKNYPCGRAAQPVEIANAALFLLSSEASHVSGATLAVDGCVTT